MHLEAYTTGTVTTTTSIAPCDIVLVLDQSGSMAYNFDGNETSTDSARRQYAMKQAVNTFIEAVADKYNAEKSDHRIAVVTFGTNASTLMDWTLVTPAETDTAESPSGETALKAKINGLPSEPEGATNVADGMRSAQALMQGDSGYTGTNTKRQKVVILFTDGVPTKQSDFDTTVANGAIQSAKALKDAGATVYSVGIFNGANPEQLYGDSGFKYNSNGQVGSYWASFSWWGIGDVKNYDIPAGNRFLNYISGNFPDATEIVKDDLKDIFAMADIVVSRAGANAICELLALKKPNLLIPLSAGASRGDQILNARSFEAQGFSMVIDEDYLSPGLLIEKVHASTNVWICNPK